MRILSSRLAAARAIFKPVRAAAFAILTLAGAIAPASAQQRADTDFSPEIAAPAFEPGTGPIVKIDEAHHNFHTSTGRYQPFAELLRRDGYQVSALGEAFSAESLAGTDILVIANPLSERNLGAPVLPTHPAFTREEIVALAGWVENGGGLLLIADHMPWGGAAASLASAFGFLFSDGFALSLTGSGPARFDAQSGLDADHPVVKGRHADETVESVMTFTGQAFRLRTGAPARPLIRLGDDMVLLMPVEAWKFSPQTPRLSASGMLQGATVEYGRGRVAVFGEAAMFSAQISGNGGRMGMNHPEAGDNAQFALNVLHWLSQLY